MKTKTALLYLVGVLADSLRERADESRSFELRWRERLNELEESLPEPAERTVEQWKSLIALMHELHYSIVVQLVAGVAARRAERLVEALAEETQRAG